MAVGKIMASKIQSVLSEAERTQSLATYDTEAMRNRFTKLVKSGELVSPLRKLDARVEYWESLDPHDRMLHKMRGLSALDSGVVFGGFSAALAHGLRVPFHLLDRPVVTTTAQSNTGSTQRLCRIVVEDDASTMAAGFRVTSFERTLFDCLRRVAFKDGLVIADSALAMMGNNRDALIELMQRFHGRWGSGRVESILAHADGRSESGLESLARAFLIEHGYLLPDRQVVIPNLFGSGMNYRVDFCWGSPQEGFVVGECDGKIKYQDPVMTEGRDAVDVMMDERQREAELTATGARVMRISHRDVVDPERMERKLAMYGIPKVQSSWLEGSGR